MDAGHNSPGLDDTNGGYNSPGLDGTNGEEVVDKEVGHELTSSTDTDDVSSDGYDLTTDPTNAVTTDDTETDNSDADIGENGINTEKRVSFKDTKEDQKRKENLYTKLEAFRKPRHSVLGKRFTCHNIRYFVVIFAVIVFLRSCMSSYLHMVSHEVGRRYYNNHYEMDFITGVEKIGVAVMLVFTSYYGNKFFKPISILCGAVLCGIGAIISAMPYFILKERRTDREDTIPTYIVAGLCHAGAVTNVSYSEQCAQHPGLSLPEENKGSFSLFCTAHFFIGIGTAFLIPGGIVYTVEAERSAENPLYIGLFLGSHGLGQFIGSLFGFWFIKYPENLSGELAIYNWHIGAWWLGFLVFGSLLIVLPFTLLAFPRWIREPRWLLYRKYRHQLRLERWKKREQEARRERRKKKRQKLKKERERKKIKEKNKSTGVSIEDNLGSDSAEASGTTENGAAATLEPQDTADLNSNNSNIHEMGGTDANVKNALSKTSNLEISSDAPKSAEETLSADGNMPTEQSSGGSTPVVNTSSGEKKTLYKKHSQGKHVRISESSKTSEKGDENVKENDENLTPAQMKRQRSVEKNMKRHRLGRRLQDLPKNLKFLVKRPMFLITVLGAAVSLYFQTGFYPTFHRYFHIQFQYSHVNSTMIAGILFGLGMLLGALVSSVVIFRYKMSLKRQFLLSLIIQAITLIMVLILMALGCDVQQGPVHRTEIGLQTSCATNCDCLMSQLSRVCSKDGSMSYLSPCHAGCKLAHVDQESNKNIHYTECTCELSLKVAPEWCETHCKAAAGFIICCLVAVVSQSIAFVSLILLMIQSHPEKLRSLNLGFSFWIIYIIAVVPGVAVYTYFYTTSCAVHGVNCQEDVECWSSDVTKYRYITSGATLAFLAVGLALLVGAFFVFLKVNRDSPRSKKDMNECVTNKTDIQLTQVPDSSDNKAKNGASNRAFEAEHRV